MCGDCYGEDWDDRDPEPDPDPDDDSWDDDPFPDREPPEPNCFGCYDSGFTRRGRRCPGCNPSGWQRIFYGARWHLVVRSRLWLDRKIHRRRNAADDPWGEPPF